MAFSAQTPEFLFENSMRDSKEWFQEHKEAYKSYVTEPFSDFILQMQPYMQQIDKNIICDPRKLPRIYRDTRFSKNKAIFREDLWYSFGQRHDSTEICPEFYFDISPEGFTYGLGYYQAGTDRMDVLRRMILNGSESFFEAKEAFEGQKAFAMCGEEYKKDHYPDAGENLKRWLNKRNLYFSKSSNDFETLYREDLASLIAADFLKIKEIYYFFMEVEQQLATEKNKL